MRPCGLHLLRSSAALWLVACGPKAPALGSGSATDPGDTATTDPALESSGTSTSAPNPTSTTTNPTTSGPPDLPCLDCTTGPPPDLPPVDCNIWTQDCPAGQKCVPYSADGVPIWSADGCFPVVEHPVPLGEPCTFEGDPFTGLDNCDVGAICWDGNGDDNFTCAPLCAGTADALTCPPGHYCAAFSEILTVCELPTCDPLAQDCPDPAELCLPNIYLWEDWCLADDSPLANQVHEPCDTDTECAAGLVCVSNIVAAAECKTGAFGCCEPVCALGVGTCPGVGQACVPWVEALGLGLCQLPSP